MIGLCEAEGIGVIPWSPLARGRLARTSAAAQSTDRAQTDAFGKTLYRSAEEADRQVIDRVGKVASSRGIARAQVALAWLLSKSAVTAPIVGASKPGHLQDAVAALEVRLTPEELVALEELYVPHAVSGFS